MNVEAARKLVAGQKLRAITAAPYTLPCSSASDLSIPPKLVAKFVTFVHNHMPEYAKTAAGRTWTCMSIAKPLNQFIVEDAAKFMQLSVSQPGARDFANVMRDFARYKLPTALQVESLFAARYRQFKADCSALEHRDWVAMAGSVDPKPSFAHGELERLKRGLPFSMNCSYSSNFSLDRIAHDYFSHYAADTLLEAVVDYEAAPAIVQAADEKAAQDAALAARKAEHQRLRDETQATEQRSARQKSEVEKREVEKRSRDQQRGEAERLRLDQEHERQMDKEREVTRRKVLEIDLARLQSEGDKADREEMFKILDELRKLL